MSEYELYHHGIGGMHWGIRRFQNEDGSLTPEGELRYNQGKERASRAKAAEAYKTKKFKAKLALKSKKQKIKDAAEEARTLKKEESKLTKKVANMAEKKKVGEMSDEELRHEIDRLGMELDYNIKKYHAGKGVTMLDKVNAAISTPLGQTITQLGVDVAKNAANRYVNNILDSKFDAEKVARTRKILTETVDSTRKTNADIAKVREEASVLRDKANAQIEKTHAERDKINQEARNSRAKTVSKINEDRKDNNQTRANKQADFDEDLRSKKESNKWKEEAAARDFDNEYGHNPTSKQAQLKFEVAKAKQEAKLAEYNAKISKAKTPSMDKDQRETLKLQAEIEQQKAQRDVDNALRRDMLTAAAALASDGKLEAANFMSDSSRGIVSGSVKTVFKAKSASKVASTGKKNVSSFASKPASVVTSPSSYKMKSPFQTKTVSMKPSNNFAKQLSGTSKSVGSIGPITKTSYDIYGQAVNSVKQEPISVVLDNDALKKIKF